MQSWLNARSRRDLIYRLSLQSELDRRVAATSPAAFRQRLRLTATSEPLGRHLEPWQRTDFEALDAAWTALAARTDGKGPRDWSTGENLSRQRVYAGTPSVYRRAWIERPRGHAKTSDMAVQLLWILLFGGTRVRGLVAAADREQASLVRTAMLGLVEANPELCAGLEFRQHWVTNPRTGSLLEILASEVAGSWGKLPDFVICDELCHWEKPDLWYSLFSSAAKRPQGLLAVLTNAGAGRGWQWELREAARTSPEWYFASLPGPAAPWLSPEQLAEQERLLPRSVYDRLWRNEWQEAGGEFVTPAEVRACRDDSLMMRSNGEHGVRYWAAVDYAEKRDNTVGVVVHHDGRRWVVDRMDVVTPGPDRPTPVKWVDEWIERTAQAFGPVTFVVDEYQLVGTIQRLEGRHDVKRFEFRGGQGNHALALHLRQLIVDHELGWYPDCGRVLSGSPSSTGDDDLEQELLDLVLRQMSGGRVRIDHIQDGRHHDDRAFALGAAVLMGAREGTTGEWMVVA